MDATSQAETGGPARLVPYGEGTDLVELAQQALLDAYRPGDDWTDMFDRLAPAEIESLMALFPYMPPRAARHFAERFIIPAR